jgi:hypothetical protein
MSSYSYNTVVLKGDFIRKEAKAGGTITPGMLIEDDGSGNFQAHSTAAGTARKLFALENSMIGDAISDDYSSGDRTQAGLFYPGAEVFALLATGNNVSVGDALESDGSGALQKHSATTTIDATATTTYTIDDDDVIVAYALEAVNNTSGDNERIVVEIA